ncbi:hypothetical protein E0K89_014995 [Aquicoccus sp. SCR17]|nr:hypothetical protein [Carideicomes alvinocaridis]
MTSFRTWCLLTLLAILVAIALPYGLLSGNAAPFDIALVWLGFGLVVIVLVALGTARWRG